RIDLGLGRSPGGPPAAIRALNPDANTPRHFLQQVDELRDYLANTPSRGVRLSPESTALPIYLLGASDDTARAAAERDLPFVIAPFLAKTATTPAIAAYRAASRAPQLILAVGVVCQATMPAAEHDLVSYLAVKSRLHALPSEVGPDQAAAALRDPPTTTEHDNAEQALAAGGLFVGDPASIRASIADLVDTTRPDEIILLPFTHSATARTWMLTHLAETENERAPTLAPRQRKVDPLNS
ncbi:MAG: hypothetical protein QOD39_1786, partial [Mycobacterium sp.]|nr:hypothetical protein [Mycobacterium sp.]